jgi:hypothetical protein
VDIAVIRLPHISNFTDFNALEQHPALGVRYVDSLVKLGNPDMIVLPGTKSTISDLLWLRQCGLEAEILKAADTVDYVTERYVPSCMHARNRALVDGSDLCVAFLKENRGGTLYTCSYALKHKVELINLADDIKKADR